ncbi:MAG: zinc-binding dehydrogenase [Candidatus Methylomirabilis oxygeniifera]|uniref:Alcohol dehydrogenase, zinc-binding domain protein n=1 Tax=Methylomirabilis oxygeniifera TaxID=671143 RepID=D5MK52_METO1|nr:MAG: zinc-binding dehydrogenase [Candidatus Methylomirabilis oxyfera]CBE69674.1 Alcohol dehydrogenase, zinc-binding domain protein [Candidatus Methylomirabilis oxyfera]
MKAVRFHEHGGPEVLRYEDAPDPIIAPHEVLVKVKACALNHLDLWCRKGMLGMQIPLPHISGSDVAGEVAAVGSVATRITLGQRVVVSPGISCGQCACCLSGRDNLCRSYEIVGGYRIDGGYAEYVKVPEVNILPIPEEMDFEAAAAFPLTFLTAWNMLVNLAHVKRGDEVLVMGAGSGVGTAAIQIAKLFGARVIAAAGSDDKLGKAKGLGADDGINYADQDLVIEARRLTAKRGVDVIFEHVGGAVFEKLIPALATGGRLVTCGATAGHLAQTDIRYLFMRQASIMGGFMGPKADLLQIVREMARGTLKPVVDRLFPLKEAAAAQCAMEDRTLFGKLVLVI